MGVEATRLCLVASAGASASAAGLAAVLGRFDIASVVLAPAPGHVLDAQTAKPLIETVQKAGAAALLLGNARLARTLKADGVHLPPGDKILAAYEEAREILGRGAIVGADAGRSRHDAMALGESGADYIGFGVPASVKEQAKARERRLELIEWWAEIFEIPAVAFDVASTEDARELAMAGADFIAMTLPDGASPADLCDHVAAFVNALGAAAG